MTAPLPQSLAELVARKDQDELDELRQCCVQQKARLQILYSMIPPADWCRMLDERPEMAHWFDEDGVPR